MFQQNMQGPQFNVFCTKVQEKFHQTVLYFYLHKL